MLILFAIAGVVISLAVGIAIAIRYFKNRHPAVIIFGGLGIGVGLSAVVLGILYAGCIILMRRIG